MSGHPKQQAVLSYPYSLSFLPLLALLFSFSDLSQIFLSFPLLSFPFLSLSFNLFLISSSSYLSLILPRIFRFVFCEFHQYTRYAASQVNRELVRQQTDQSLLRLVSKGMFLSSPPLLPCSPPPLSSPHLLISSPPPLLPYSSFLILVLAPFYFCRQLLP